MSNNLTGDYEAVLEVSVRQINGILATFHQNSGEKGKSPHFPHTVPDFRIGKPPKILDPSIASFSKWLAGAVKSVRGAGGSGFMSEATPLEIGAHLAATAPPGVTAELNRNLRDLITARDEATEAGSVSGLADIQVSTPAISLERTRVILHVYVRAQYFPEPGTPALPVPINGEVRVAYEARAVVKNGKNLLQISVPPDDSSIQFFPAPNSGPTQADADAKIAVHLRKAMRETFQPNPVDLGTTFNFFEFKSLGSPGNLHDHAWRDALGTGDEQALVLPVQLSDAAVPPGAIDRVTNLFLGIGPDRSDFAIAISREYVESTFKPALVELLKIQDRVVNETTGLLPSYRLSITGATLKWNVGWIEFNITAKATTPNEFAPDFEKITINQKLRLVLAADQSMSLEAANSDPELSVSVQLSNTTFISNSEAEGFIRTLVPSFRDPALAAAKANIKETFGNTLAQLNEALKFKDPDKPGVEPLPVPASARYTAVEINPDGIIVRGDMDTLYHYQPQPVIDYTRDGLSFSALNSWIPGGRIDRFAWQWVEQAVFRVNAGGTVSHFIPGVSSAPSPFEEYFTIPWEGTVHSETFHHRFTHAIPAELLDRPSWSKGVCLTIEGTQVAPDGTVVGVSGGVKSGTCTVSARQPLIALDPIKYAVNEILGWPEPPGPVEKLDANLLGHINVLAAAPFAEGGPGTNTLIHFAGREAATPMRALGQAMGKIRRRDFALTFVIVLPKGALARTRREVEEHLGLDIERESGPAHVAASGESAAMRTRESESPFPVPLVITEDYAQSWSRVFGAGDGPATYLVNARGEFVWKDAGHMNPETLPRALDEQLLPSHLRPPQPVRLNVQVGELAPDFRFADNEGRTLGLRRLFGKPVRLVFWQSWSSPCIKELQMLQGAGGERAPVIIAINGGEDRKVIEEVRLQHKFTFAFVPDEERRITQLYGIACWPTTVSIHESGIVSGIQFGVTHEHRVEPGAAAS